MIVISAFSQEGLSCVRRTAYVQKGNKPSCYDSPVRGDADPLSHPGDRKYSLGLSNWSPRTGRLLLLRNSTLLYNHHEVWVVSFEDMPRRVWGPI
jgi:hypothetical protein